MTQDEIFAKLREDEKFKIGTSVIVKQKVSDNLFGWNKRWDSDHDKVLGLVGIITQNDHDRDGLVVKFPILNEDMWCHPLSLEPTDKSPFESLSLPGLDIKPTEENLIINGVVVEWSLINEIRRAGVALGAIDTDDY